MLLLKRSTPSGYRNMTQGKSAIGECAAIALGWPMAYVQGVCTAKIGTVVFSQNLDHTTMAEGCYGS